MDDNVFIDNSLMTMMIFNLQELWDFFRKVVDGLAHFG